MHASLARTSRGAIPLHAVTAADAAAWLSRRKDRALLKASGFAGADGALAALPDGKGGIAAWVLGLGAAGKKGRRDVFALAAAAEKLPAGLYRLEDVPDWCGGANAALAWAMGGYRFGRYRKARRPGARLVLPPGVDGEEISRIADNLFMGRDLVNTPANDMGPAELEAAARTLARRHGARVRVVAGAALKRGYPLIAAVGQGSERAPRLIELLWGPARAPKVTLVGKGVCFDTGGLDLKPSSAMLTMKKDMGGAACVLALAGMAMGAKLRMRLRVLIPAVENSVSGRAMRPGDVFSSRKGLTVEVGNTDAEGRLVLADALALADEDKPDLLIDLGTLTGAARVALGPELPPFYTNDEALAADVARCAVAENDPLWRMPLWPPYDSWLDSKTADITNAPSGGFAGSITCALFLQRFVERAKSWLHVDIYAWTPSAKPARPEGGECQAARALYKLLSERYA
ncbi:MAG TPA: leucyl aminopeptidase family protein [Rhizomicrobium sp.]|nr:leucyl aminopeptidase family protein [Rhizomicrobium sp.]